jgi:hypothetical protein
MVALGRSVLARQLNVAVLVVGCFVLALCLCLCLCLHNRLIEMVWVNLLLRVGLHQQTRENSDCQR